ncbi:WG repeat-containing protein [Chitinophaga sp. 22321]|uniref:WG repeat-containing protein n=1 Tax=Chitinophaga hostae TaxID=2831022 RepID=A0ABS5J3Z6_9BACT|nr:WG repeat-containing protein [Chitinophaga hostae]MBS0029939.1 WG repeat-containing protein [Chitinophaga hostae]
MKGKYLAIVCLLSGGPLSAQQPVIADYLDRFDGEFATVMIARQKQLLHHSGKVLIDKLENISYYRSAVGVKHNAYGAFNDAGKIIAPFKFDDVTIRDEKDEKYPEKNYHFAITRLNGRYGAVDSEGKQLCAPVYNEIDGLSPRLIKIKRDGLWGWADMKTGKVLQSPKYEQVDNSYVRDSTVQITQDGKRGLAAEDGSIIVKPAYESFNYLGYQGSTFFGYTINGKTGIMNKAGHPITPAIYDKCSRGPSPVLFAVTSNDKTGITDAAGKLLLPLQYTRVEGVANAMKAYIGTKCGIIGGTGKEIIPVQYDDIKAFNTAGQEMYDLIISDGNQKEEAAQPYYFMVRKGALTTLFDQTGKQLLPFKYAKTALYAYHDSLYIQVTEQGKTGLLDLQGKTVLPLVYEDLLSGYNDGFSYQDDAAGKDRSDYLPVLKNGNLGLYNVRSGKEMLPPVYNRIRWHNSHILSLSSGDSASMADRSGRVIKAAKKYGFFTAVDTNRIVETQYPDNGTTLCILTDLAGNKLYTNPSWEFKEDTYSRALLPAEERNGHAQFNNGLLKIWGDPRNNVFVDEQGKEVVFENYSFVGDFRNGLALAGKDLSPEHTVYGIINRQQQVVLPVNLNDITTFQDSILMIRQADMKGLIRKDGSILLPVAYERIDKMYGQPYIKVTAKKKEGITDINGKIILPAVYDEVSYYEKAKLFKIEKAGKSGIADAKGNIVIPVLYDEMEVNRSYDNIFPLLVKEGKWFFYLDKDGKPFPYRSLKKKSYND